MIASTPQENTKNQFVIKKMREFRPDSYVRYFELLDGDLERVLQLETLDSSITVNL